jgi:hypothetical protein
LVLTVSTYSIKAQVKGYTFVYKIKKMSDDDPFKKREGTFVTGLPDFFISYRFSFGIRSNVIGMENEQIPFAYTPYLKVKS